MYIVEKKCQINRLKTLVTHYQIQLITVVFRQIEGHDRPNPHSAICPSPSKKKGSKSWMSQLIQPLPCSLCSL